LRAHPEVDDILLTGGDPLAIPNSQLIPFLQKVVRIGHLKTIRIHSRAISTRPERIDDELIGFLGSDPRFWYYGHMNHPDDINHRAVKEAIHKLLGARIPVLNQAVLLGGVNDRPETLKTLMKLCYENKVIPYHLYVLDRVKGASHFHVPNDRIVELYRSLADLPGPAQPVLVYVDATNIKHRAVPSQHIDLSKFLEARGAPGVRQAS
jgi:KamA family protein